MKAKTQQPIREKFNEFLAAYLTAEQRQRLPSTHFQVMQDCFFSGAIAAHMALIDPDITDAKQMNDMIVSVTEELQNFCEIVANHNLIKTAKKD